MSDAKEIERQLEHLTAFVAERRAAVANGESITLEGMEKEILGLCEAVRVSPREQAREFMPRLTKLLTDIHLLGEALTMQRDALTQEIQGLDQHKKAAVAYTQRSGKPEEE